MQISVGYVRADRYHPTGPQIAALVSAGVRRERIYTEGVGSETLAAAVRATDPGEALAVVGLHRLGSHWPAVVAVLDQMARDGLRIWDVERSVMIDPAAAAAVMDARRVIAGVRRMPSPEIARERASRRAPSDGWSGMSADARKTAIRLWTSHELTAVEAAEAIGVSPRTAYRWVEQGFLPARGS